MKQYKVLTKSREFKDIFNGLLNLGIQYSCCVGYTEFWIDPEDSKHTQFVNTYRNQLLPV